MYHTMKKFFILLFSVLPLFSNQSIIDKALKLNLDQNRYWLQLLHFENGASTINNKAFFLSKSGKRDAKNELIATLQAFESNNDTICRYPARYKWLNSKLFLHIKQPKCKALHKFLEPHYKSISVIFTSERYNSAASVFGHTFLKLNTDTIPYAINYSASVPDKENQFMYAFKGISGKYKSRYTLLTYSMKDYEYRSKEFRDLVEFKLNLNADEIENIMLHLYEIKDTNQNYYFMSRNCSSELIKLLDLAKENLGLTQRLQTPAIPIDIIYILQKYNLVDRITIKKSKLKQFYLYIGKLSKKEKFFLLQIIKNKISVDTFDKTSNLSIKRKSLVIISAIKYMEIISAEGKFTTKYTSKLLQLLKLKYRYKIKDKLDSTQVLKKNPISNKFHKLSIGTKYSVKNFKQINFGYRYLYRNRFDLVDAIRKNGTVELFDLNLKLLHNKILLDKLTLVNLEAMPVSNAFFQETTNKIKLGLKRLFFTDTLYSYLDYGLGYKYQLDRDLEYSIFATTGIYYENRDVYLASVENSLEYYYKNIFINEIKYELNFYSNGIKSYNFYINNYIKISKSTTLNLFFEHKIDVKVYNNIVINYNYMF